MRKTAIALCLPALFAALPAGAQQDGPTSGWVFVGRVAEGGRFTAGPAVDAKATSVNAGKVARLQLARDAALSTSDDCTKVKLEDLKAPTDEELKKQHPLVKAEPRSPLTVESTSECASAGNGKLVYAKVSVPADRVRYATLAELTKR